MCREAAAKERLAMLKSNDVAAYLKLVQSAKNSRLNQLLSQTDACLNNLAARLRLKGNAETDADLSAATAGATDTSESSSVVSDILPHWVSVCSRHGCSMLIMQATASSTLLWAVTMLDSADLASCWWSFKLVVLLRLLIFCGCQHDNIAQT